MVGLIKLNNLFLLSCSLLISAYAYSKDIGLRCGDTHCDKVAKEIALASTPQRPFIYKHVHYLKVPIFSDMTAIATPTLAGQNYYHNIYYYGEAQSISISYIDENYDFDLLQESENIFMLNNGETKAYYYEAGNSKGHHLEPIFEVIIPIMIGHNERFIKYVTRGLPKEEVISLISQIGVNGK